MGIKVTKPEVNIREKLNELTQEQGIKGTEILRADDAQTVRNAIGAGRKNLIINGAMQVSQRGDFTSASQISPPEYTIDRFKSNTSIVVATKQHKLNQSVDGGIKNTLACVVTTAGTGWVYQYQNIELEDMRRYQGKTLTVSCWIKSNNSAFGIILYDSNTWYKVAVNTGNGAWQKITHTFTCDSLNSGAFTLGVSNFGNGAAASALAVGDYFEFTELQLELGSVATDFEHRSYGEELALCQRYFWRTTGTAGDGYAGIGSGHVRTNTQIRVVIPNPVTMRTNPTLSISGIFRGNAGPANSNVTVILASWTGKVSSMAEFTHSGLTSGYGCILHHMNNTSNYLQMDSEL